MFFLYVFFFCMCVPICVMKKSRVFGWYASLNVLVSPGCQERRCSSYSRCGWRGFSNPFRASSMCWHFQPKWIWAGSHNKNANRKFRTNQQSGGAVLCSGLFSHTPLFIFPKVCILNSGHILAAVQLISTITIRVTFSGSESYSPKCPVVALLLLVNMTA